MRRVLTLLLIALSIVACNNSIGDTKDKEETKECSVDPKLKELCEITDYFVDQLSTKYESYGIAGGFDHVRFTRDRRYKVTPIGRMINVRIEKSMPRSSYNELRRNLSKYYKNNRRVNSVYINKAGTIMIDCRN